MGWSEKWKKKDESKMKAVICIIAKLAFKPTLLSKWKISDM